MSICKVCGRKVANINCNIVRGASGEWVCKDCLKKAHIGVMKFSSFNITSGEIMSRIYTESCNGQNNSEISSEITEHRENEATKGLHCPRCHNTDLEIISDVKSKGVSGTKLFLFGFWGLAGSGKVKTTHYWICKRCGYKFKV